MAETTFGGTILGEAATQEQADRIHKIVEPMAQALLDLSPDDCFSVTGSLMMTFALRYDKPIEAAAHLASLVMSRIPEAMDVIMKKAND